MTQELALRNQVSVGLSPQDIVLVATEQSRLLMSIVEQTKCFQVISGKKYLQVEAWETIGAFNRVHAVTESITPIIDAGVKVGYDAKVTLVNQDGILVGAAIMPCYFTENACKGKEGDAKDKACKSAAQTFATSKAYRMNYSYVAILAGYQPTPAEEMTGESPDDRPANLDHWCGEHKTKFFKRGKMQGYAHRIGNTDQWCNEDKPIHSVEKVAREMAQAKSSPPADDKSELAQSYQDYAATPPSPVESVNVPPDTGFDMEWLRENIGVFGKGTGALLAWLRSKQNYVGLNFSGSLSEIVARMTPAQKEFLASEIEDRLKML